MEKSYPLLVSLLCCILLTACPGRRAMRTPVKALDSPSQTTYFDQAGLKFTLAPGPLLSPVNPDSVVWTASLPNTPENGPLMYYFAEGEALRLISPHIRMEYISKSMQGTESVESLFSWLKNVFINDDRKGQLVTDKETVLTQDGQKVRVLEIHTPKVSIEDGEGVVERPAKQMLWAYISQGDFFIGVNFSTHNQHLYREMRREFLQLIQSYRAG